jgi:hypothetical protein
MMSATPIFEQLCREILDTGNARPNYGTQPLRTSQPKGPAHSLETGVSGYERSSYQPHTLAGWSTPTG